jgi:uncharacterized protein with FMN-binding domain
MRRVICALAGTIAGLVLLLSFKTHGTTARGTPSAAGTAATAAGTAPAGSSTSGAGRSTTGGSGTSSSAPTTVSGDVSQTQYGPVQVQITVEGGKVTGVRATQHPSEDPRSQQINAYAIPILNQEALKAGSAGIDMVAGATYTSDGYLSSLQSALDKAGVA